VPQTFYQDLPDPLFAVGRFFSAISRIGIPGGRISKIGGFARGIL